MKILMVNKFLYPKGGAETYVLKLGDYLQQAGHQVQYFGMDDENRTVGNDVNAYTKKIDFHNCSFSEKLRYPFRIIYSFEARKKIRKVLDDFQPDVVHLNNIQFHLTPSVILEANKFRKESGKRLKIIYTAHDYQLICPSHGLFDSEIKICEKCLTGNYWHCFAVKCVKNSRVKSMLGMVDAYVWKFSKAYTCIDSIICCSAFLKSKLDSQQRFRQKTVVLQNFMDPAERIDVAKEDYVLEFGHLSKDKGTYTLLEAAERIPEARFIFAGFGAAEKDITKVKNAEYIGFRTGKDLEMLIRKAKLSVYPSEWYENCPFSVIESQIYGTPVIGSKIGGIPELIDDGKTGELFEAGNVDNLECKLRKMLFTDGILEGYIENCFQKKFETSESYYKKLIEIYRK